MKRARKPAQSAIFSFWALAGIALSVMLTTRDLDARAAEPVTIGGPWTLVASDGSTVTEQSYIGKWLLVFFGYTSCPNICPTSLFEIAVALEKLGPDAAEVQPIFVTVDPQHDTPDIMREYTASFDPRIVGLTGNAEQIAAAVKEYGVYHVTRIYGAGGGNRIIDHSAYLYVMNPQGKFVRAFDADASGHLIAATLSDLMAKRRLGRSNE